MRALEGVAETVQLSELRRLRRRVAELEAALEEDDSEFTRLHGACYSGSTTSHAVKVAQLSLAVAGWLLSAPILLYLRSSEAKLTVSQAARSLLHQFERSQVYREGMQAYSGSIE